VAALGEMARRISGVMAAYLANGAEIESENEKSCQRRSVA
jgi:hypothetical protein